MKNLFMIAGILLALLPVEMKAWTVPQETLEYEVHYKWGLINANAGVATIKTEPVPGTNLFRATLTGKSVNLLGHYYEAGDVLTGTMLADSFRPVYNERITQESGEFTIETVCYDHSGGTASGESFKTLPDGTTVKSRVSHYGGGLTLDLLAVFYYMRQVDYQAMQPGQTVTDIVFAGSSPEVLTIVYNGQETMEYQGQQRQVYRVSMSFTARNGGAGTSDSMSAVISANDSRIPLIVDGKLKFGHLHCSFIGNE